MNLTISGVASLIKFRLLAFLFILSSCSSLTNVKNIYVSTKDKFTIDKLTVSELKKIKLESTASIVNINDADDLLAYYQNDSNSWITSDGKRFVIKNGKVIKTIGFEYDFIIYKYKGMDKLETNKAIIEFKSPPSGLMEINFNYSLLSEGQLFSRIQNKNIKYRLIREDFNVEIINWSDSNFYWIDSKNNILMTKQ